MTGKLKRYDVGYDQSGKMVSEEAHGEYVEFFYVEEFLRELIAMEAAAEAELAQHQGTCSTERLNWMIGNASGLMAVADRARALLGEEAAGATKAAADRTDYGYTRAGTESSRAVDASVQRVTSAIHRDRQAFAELGAAAFLVCTGPHCKCSKCGARPLELGVFNGPGPHQCGVFGGEQLCLACARKRGEEGGDAL